MSIVICQTNSDTIYRDATKSFYYANKPTEFMREKPTEESFIVSEVLYGESIQRFDKQEEKDSHGTTWIRIKTFVDGYPGWIKKDAVCEKSSPYFDEKNCLAVITQKQAPLYSTADIRYGPSLFLPFGVVLKFAEQIDNRWTKVSLLSGKEAYIQTGDIVLKKSTLTKSELLRLRKIFYDQEAILHQGRLSSEDAHFAKQKIVQLSKQFLEVPYIWGGRSSFGFDCSGFIQMLYRNVALTIPRDAKDQVNWKGFESIAFSLAEAGDLLFFGPKGNAVNHVALYLGEQQMIHATTKENQPRIHISKVTDKEWNNPNKFCEVRRLISRPRYATNVIADGVAQNIGLMRTALEQLPLSSLLKTVGTIAAIFIKTLF